MLFSRSRWSGMLGRRDGVRQLPALEYPLAGVERVAVLGTRFLPERQVRSYVHWRTPELEAWRPQALAGHRSELFSMGELRRKQFVFLKDLRFPLVVLSSLREGPLRQDQHDQLWKLYGLPVFEQIRSVEEVLLGWECDARDGYHLATDAEGRTRLTPERVRAAGWQGTLSQGQCGCGLTCLKFALNECETRISQACSAD